MKGLRWDYNGEEERLGVRKWVLEYLKNIDVVLFNCEFVGVIIVVVKFFWCRWEVVIFGYFCILDGCFFD